MKKHVKEPEAPPDGLTGRSSGNRKLYAARLGELGLPLEPIKAEVRCPDQFQVARLAATLGAGAGDSKSPTELAGQAVQLWQASGRAMFIERQTDVMVRGLFCLDRGDWEAHGRALIASLDDLEGAVPGQNPAELVRQSHEAAQRKAGLAVSQVWKYGPRNGAALKGLFAGKAETEDSRAKGLAELLSFAICAMETCESLTWRAKDSDRLRWCVLHAWEPLGIWDEAVIEKGLQQAREFIAKPDGALAVSLVGFYPFVARWLAVMRQHQLAGAKARA
jgi:hypothetical protein